MQAYIIVFILGEKIIPVGKIYYDLKEAREQKEKLNEFQLPTIIKFEAGKPPSVTF